jgi:hypothetical protein
MDTLFRITHSSNFNTSIQALMVIEQLATSKHIEVDRFYRTLYESLLDPRLVNSSKHALYLNLLFRALRSDLSVKRVKAFTKRMLQIVTLHQPPFICGVFYLLKPRFLPSRPFLMIRKKVMRATRKSSEMPPSLVRKWSLTYTSRCQPLMERPPMTAESETLSTAMLTRAVYGNL